MDNDDYIEYYEELMKQLDSTVSKFLDDGTLYISQMLMTMSKEEKRLTLDKLKMKDSQIKSLFLFAYQNEHYEVCQVIKEKLAADSAH